MSRERRAFLILVPVALLGLGAAPYVPWEDLTEADVLYALATRFSSVGGHRVLPRCDQVQLLSSRITGEVDSLGWHLSGFGNQASNYID